MLDPGQVMCGGGDFRLNSPSFPENRPTAVGMLGSDLELTEDVSWLAAAAADAVAAAAAVAAAYWEWCCEAKRGGGPPRLRKGLPPIMAPGGLAPACQGWSGK